MIQRVGINTFNTYKGIQNKQNQPKPENAATSKNISFGDWTSSIFVHLDPETVKLINYAREQMQRAGVKELRGTAPDGTKMFCEYTKSGVYFKIDKKIGSDYDPYFIQNNKDIVIRSTFTDWQDDEDLEEIQRDKTCDKPFATYLPILLYQHNML